MKCGHNGENVVIVSNEMKIIKSKTKTMVIL